MFRAGRRTTAGVAGLLTIGMAAVALIAGAGDGSAAVRPQATHTAHVRTVAVRTPADGQTLTLNYNCGFPLIGTQPLSVTITTNIPATVAVGSAMGPVAFTAVTTASATATEAMNLIGATTVTGSALAAMTVAAPQFNPSLDVLLPIPVTPAQVPASGQLQVTANGEVPGVIMKQAGTATVTTGDLTLTLTPLLASGQPTGLGTFTSTCTLASGQNNTLATITIQ